MISFLITDPGYYTSYPRLFAAHYVRILRKKRPDAVIFRDKSGRQTRELARRFVSISRRFGIKDIFINQHMDLAQAFHTGIHLTGTQHRYLSRMKRSGKKVIVSTHSKAEIQRCKKAYPDYLLFSPIFFVKNKGNPKGLEELNQITANIRANIIALGGITSDAEVKRLTAANPYGFASIRYFTKIYKSAL